MGTKIKLIAGGLLFAYLLFLTFNKKCKDTDEKLANKQILTLIKQAKPYIFTRNKKIIIVMC